jgi:hypothetical protein
LLKGKSGEFVYFFYKWNYKKPKQNTVTKCKILRQNGMYRMYIVKKALNSF